MEERKNKTFNFYGIRKTSNENYYSVTLCAGKDENREWINVPVKKERVKFSSIELAYYVKLQPLKEIKRSLNKEVKKEKQEKKEKQDKKDDLPF